MLALFIVSLTATLHMYVVIKERSHTEYAFITPPETDCQFRLHPPQAKPLRHLALYKPAILMDGLFLVRQTLEIVMMMMPTKEGKC